MCFCMFLLWTWSNWPTHLSKKFNRVEHAKKIIVNWEFEMLNFNWYYHRNPSTLWKFAKISQLGRMSKKISEQITVFIWQILYHKIKPWIRILTNFSEKYSSNMSDVPNGKNLWIIHVNISKHFLVIQRIPSHDYQIVFENQHTLYWVSWELCWF